MIKLQLIVYWITVGFYAIASILFIFGLNFKKDFNRLAILFTGLGFLVNSLGMGLRWYQTGHFPYYGIYEVFTSNAWGVVLIYLILQYKFPNLRFLGAILLPMSFLAIGVGVMGSTEIKEIPRTFFTFWLGVHIAFAKLSYGSAIISSLLAVIYLFKLKKGNQGNLTDNQQKESRWLSKFPALKEYDELIYKFVALAFFMLAVMIISGAIWAAKAWGRYWSWDPIETWALISWFLYGLTLHLYKTFGWRGRRLSILTIGALILVLFAFFGLPFIYNTSHEHLRVSFILFAKTVL